MLRTVVVGGCFFAKRAALYLKLTAAPCVTHAHRASTSSFTDAIRFTVGVQDVCWLACHSRDAHAGSSPKQLATSMRGQRLIGFTVNGAIQCV